MDPELSMRIPIDTGISSLWNEMMFCGFPSSNTVKALRSSVVTMCCLSSTTEACSITSSTSLRKTKTPWALELLFLSSFLSGAVWGAAGAGETDDGGAEGGIVVGGVAGLVSFCGAGDCDQASMSRLGPITNVKRRTLAALFRRRVISRPGIHP